MGLPVIHHSFIKQGDDLGKVFAQVACGVLSVLYAKRSGYKIVLHTDDEAAKLLDIAPYDEIKLDLNGLDNDFGKWVFAYPKFKAYESMDLGDVHIDLDVFLKKPCVTEYKDVIVQSIETPQHLNASKCWENSTKAFEGYEYPEWANNECKILYNCGVCGINNGNLKEEYMKIYWDMMNWYKVYGLKHKSVPDIIPEQQFLYDMIQHYNYDCKLVLPTFSSKCADQVGYQHLIGISKRFEISRVLECIYKLDEEVYNKLKNYWNEIRNFKWPNRSFSRY